MKRGYSSVLSKNILAYNLAHHLQELGEIREIAEIITRILTSFEYKEDTKPKENQE
jgi:hypothetical protein